MKGAEIIKDLMAQASVRGTTNLEYSRSPPYGFLAPEQYQWHLKRDGYSFSIITAGAD